MLMFFRSLLAVLRAAIYGWLLALIRLIKAWLRRRDDRRDERDAGLWPRRSRGRPPCGPLPT